MNHNLHCCTSNLISRSLTRSVEAETGRPLGVRSLWNGYPRSDEATQQHKEANVVKHSTKVTKTKTTKVTKKKAQPKKKVAPTAKTKALGACARVREIADGMPKAEPAAVYAKCEAAGIHPRTTRAEYANWCKAKFGETPSERFAKKG